MMTIALRSYTNPRFFPLSRSRHRAVLVSGSRSRSGSHSRSGSWAGTWSEYASRSMTGSRYSEEMEVEE